MFVCVHININAYTYIDNMFTHIHTLIDIQTMAFKDENKSKGVREGGDRGNEKKLWKIGGKLKAAMCLHL